MKMRMWGAPEGLRAGGWIATALGAVSLLAAGCGGGGGKGGSVIHVQLTTMQEVTGLDSVRLTAATVAKTFPVQRLSTAATQFNLSVPADVLGDVNVGALARPATGCMGYAGSGTAYIGSAGDMAEVAIVMRPSDICQTTGTGGDSGTGGTGGSVGAGGSIGPGGSGGGPGAGGSSGGSSGVAGSAGGTTGRGGTGGSAAGGTGGSAAGGTGGGARGGTGGSVGGTGGSVAGAGGRGGTGGGAGGTTGAGGGQVNCSAAVGGRPAAVAPPSLSHCVEYTHNDTGAVCDTLNDVNNPLVIDVAVSPDGQYMATAGTSPTDPTQDRVKVWRLSGSTPTQCPSANITNPGLGPAYVAFSPNGQYLAVAWQYDFVYLYNVPSFTLAATIKSSVSFLYGVGFSPDSQAVFTLEWDGASDGTLYADRLNGSAITSHALGVDPDVLTVSPVAGSGNVTTLAVGGFDGDAAVFTFNGTTFAAPTIIPTASAVAAWSARFSPTGNLLAIGGDDGIVRFWSIPLTGTATTGNPITITGNPTPTIFGLSFSPYGTYMALGHDSNSEIWNVTTRAFVSRATAADFVDSVSFSASGAALISGEDSCGGVLVCSD